MQTFALKTSPHNLNEVTNSSMNIINFKGVTRNPQNPLCKGMQGRHRKHANMNYGIHQAITPTQVPVRLEPLESCCLMAGDPIVFSW